MSFYSDSEFPVRDDLADAHAAQFERFARAGIWGSAAQRLAVISEARQSCIDAGMLEAPEDGGALPDVDLPKMSGRSSAVWPHPPGISTWIPISARGMPG